MSRQHFTLAAVGGLLTVALLVVVPMRAADNGNPFARWERLKAETSVPEVSEPKETPRAHKPSGSNAAYFFSPTSGQSDKTAATAETASDALAKQPAVVKKETLKKERLATKNPASAPPAQQPVKQPAEPEIADVEHWQGMLEPELEAEPLIVANAAFVSEAGDEPAIEQTSNEFFEEVEEDIGPESTENPFGEFLQDETEPAAPTINPFRTATSTETLPPELEPANTDAEYSAPLVTDTTSDVEISTSHEGPQTPAVTLQWVHHGEFNVGQECRSELVVQNTGRTAVRNVIAEAVLPAGLQVVDAAPAPTVAGDNATWSFGELQPGQTRSVDLILVPTDQGDHQLKAFVRLTGGSTSTVSVRQPMLAVRLEGPESVEVGQQVNYTVHVTNPGTGQAQNVTIQAVIPEGLEHRHGSRLTIEIGTLNPGEQRRARLSLTGSSGGPQDLAVRAIADGDLTDEVMETVAVAEPKLNIGLRGPRSTTTGQPEIYELVVVNEGKVDSNNVRVKYRLPAGFELVKADDGGKLNDTDGTIDWFVGTLEPAQARHFAVTLRSTTAGDSNHQVGVMSEHGRMTVADHQTSVQGTADLDVKVVSSQRQVAPGEETIFEIRISNSGSSPGTDVGLSCELPRGLQLVDVSGPSEHIADSGAIIFRAMPTLAPGKTVLFAVKARCNRAGNHKLRVRVASESITDALIGEATVTGTN